MTRTFLHLFIALWLGSITLFAAGPSASVKAPQLQFVLIAPGQPTLHLTEAANGVHFREYAGKVIILNFFGKHCRWCMKEIPHLVKLQKKYKGKVQVVAIHAQQPITPGERTLLDNRFRFNYPIYEYSDNPDFTQYIAHRAAWEGGLPFSLVLDGNGNVVKIFPGYVPEEKFEEVIRYLIAKRGAK